MEPQRQISRLRRSLTALWLIVLAGLGWYGWFSLSDRLELARQSIHVVHENGVLRIESASDGPFVVFGVATDKASTEDERWAVLDKPLFIVESHGGTIDIAKLTWFDYDGRLAKAPVDQNLVALYVAPSIGEQRSAYKP